MATNFKGYLIKSAEVDDLIFPEKYISLESYESTPDQREEVEAYRDDYTRDLTRVTADGMKSKVEFSLLDGLTLEQKMEVQDFFNKSMVDEKERKVHIEYWDDEKNEYKPAYFYYPDIKYQIIRIDKEKNTLIYKAIKYTLIEY